MSRKKRNESSDVNRDPDERKEFLKKSRDEFYEEDRVRLDYELGSKVTIQSQKKMKLTPVKKAKNFYTTYALAIVSFGYVLGELGHFLLGVTSKETAIDLHYGDIACQFNSTTLFVIDVPIQCHTANSSEVCESLSLNGTQYCEWNYNGLGLDYQILAGPSYIAIFTICGVILGVAADRFNRVILLAVCTAVFSVAVVLMGTVNGYWELFAFRMLAAAGEAGFSPLATGLLSDWFSEDKRGLAMAIYNWGVFGGQGVAYPIGRYITQFNFWDMGWRVCYYGTGALGLITAILTGLTLTEPEKTMIGEEKEGDGKSEVPLWKVLTQPRMLLLVIAASIRQSGGFSFAYNCDLYYRTYFPDYNLSWWLFTVTTIVGSIGVVVGGVISDKFVAKMGVKSRVFILGLSQILASPFSFGSVYFGPTLAMISLAISYFFAEMWLGILFAILVEIVPLNVRSKTVGIFLFVINNVGGNLPILVEPVTKLIGYRESLYIFYAGFYGFSSILFFITTFAMEEPKNKVESPQREQYIDNVKISMTDVSKIPPKMIVQDNDSSRL